MRILPELLNPYPYLQSRQSGHLQVSELHCIYYEVPTANPRWWSTEGRAGVRSRSIGATSIRQFT